MAGGTLPAIDVGADLQVGGAGCNRGRLDQFTINTRVQGKVDDPLLERERRVAGGDAAVA